ncbi:MAG: MarC family protein [Candidatus Omnitrophica bacterium]|nr:MarC family protein [Candidatus Omnitrophota bacterium]MBU1996743.1 MarC family protein [Candidatus Omnitrophota bacterium]
MITKILLAFIPIFVAVDAIGVLPIFISLTQELELKEKRRILYQSFWTAIIVAFVFILVGKGLFSLLGITIGDFMVAGGLVLFCIAIIDLIVQGKKRRMPLEEFGVVPLGTPLIVGPAVLTTCLIIVDQYGIIPTIISVILNVLIAAILFYFSDKVTKILGKSGAIALSKIMALLLAAIAVMMIRKGIVMLINL